MNLNITEKKVSVEIYFDLVLPYFGRTSYNSKVYSKYGCG